MNTFIITHLSSLFQGDNNWRTRVKSKDGVLVTRIFISLMIPDFLFHWLSANPFILDPSICPLILSSWIYPSIYPFIHLFILDPSIHSFWIHPSIHPSIYPFIHPSWIHPSVHPLFIHLFILDPFIHVPTVCLVFCDLPPSLPLPPSFKMEMEWSDREIPRILVTFELTSWLECTSTYECSMTAGSSFLSIRHNYAYLVASSEILRS